MTPTNTQQTDPFFDTPIEETPVPGSDTVQKGKIGRKQLMLLIGGFVFLLGVAIFGILGGFIGSDPTSKPGELSGGGASSLAPPEARPHGLDAKEKYDKYGYDGASLNPTATGAMDRQAAAGTQLLTGKDPSMARGSNESLTEADLNVIGKQTRQTTQPYVTASERKAVRQQQLNRQFDHQQTERDAIYRTMHRSPKGKEQLTEERLARRERELDQKTADALLRHIEKANGQFTSERNSTPDPTLQMAEYQQLKAKYNGVLPTSYQNLFKREIAAEQAGSFKTAMPTEGSYREGSTNESEEKAMNLSNGGFYGLSSSTPKASAISSPATQSIPAVIHGDGDAVTIQNGSTLNIRLLEETSLRLNNKMVKLPAHTLLAGTCSISADRVHVVVTSVRLDNDIYPIRLTAYDLDGRPGLSVPKLADKNRLAQGVGNSAGQAISSPYYFVPQGSFGQQVGSQLAMQVTNTAFQGVRSIVQSKLASVKVTVKPNYRIFLRSDQAVRDFTN